MVDQAAEYELQMGRKARVRQEDLLLDRYACCGEHRDEGHHEMCKLRPKQIEKPIKGQTSLIA